MDALLFLFVIASYFSCVLKISYWVYIFLKNIFTISQCHMLCLLLLLILVSISSDSKISTFYLGLHDFFLSFFYI